MELIRGTANLERRLRKPVLTIGNYDGVHRGHRAILELVVERARARGAESVLYTFEPHPRTVLQPEMPPRLLATLGQKIEILEEIGIDVLIVEDFNLDFARLEPEYFVREHIHRRINPVEVYVGYDFHFGRDREGSMRLLTETGPHLGFSVTVVPEVMIGERRVNSTRIRDLIEEGKVEEVAILLDRPYRTRGEVIQGKQRGRTIGFPTANLAPENEILPGVGVYVCEVRFLDEGEPGFGEVWHAVTNVGHRPTFGEYADRVAEAHLLDFDRDLYGRNIELSFLCRIRSELKFPSVDALKRQIARDVERGRAIFAERERRAVVPD